MVWRAMMGAACLALALGACDDETTKGGEGAGGNGGGVDLDGGGEGGNQSGGGGGGGNGDGRRDFGPGQGDGGLSAFREPCEDNLDCVSGWCVPFENRNVCTIACLDEGCPGGWGCHGVANTQPDVVFICFPPGNRLCSVCIADTDCPNGRCYELDGVNVCGVACDDDTSCPPGYGCDDVGGGKQCTPTTRSCTCDANHDGEVRVCETTSAFGACFGRETCDASQGWFGCNAPIAAREICNQVDDDCNGFTDDIDGLGEVCEREVMLEGERIACSGRLVCTREAPEPVCTASEPMGELCNFLDDDCDGEADEDFPERGEVCERGQGQCRRVGVNVCAEDGRAVTCDAETVAPQAERCNGLDDNCDGTTDEGYEGLNTACTVGIGVCRAAGVRRCSPDGTEALCDAVSGQPDDAELCNGLDDNCDGRTDEGYDDLFQPCGVGVGACRRQGFQLCSDDGSGTTCTAAAAAPGEERCNGVDDDCDGTTDEGFVNLGTACSAGEGLCARAGVMVCAPDGSAVVCNAIPVMPQGELCNGLDDDCNGRVDETFPALRTLCNVGVGACARTGVYDCSADQLSAMCNVQPGQPVGEVCNGLDDNCNGTIDDGFAELNRTCTAGVGACQRNGVFHCNAAGDDVACDAVPSDPGEERCNGLDDDCDGTVDEGYEGVDQLCSAGIGACRRAGVQVCSADGTMVICNAAAAAPDRRDLQRGGRRLRRAARRGLRRSADPLLGGRGPVPAGGRAGVHRRRRGHRVRGRARPGRGRDLRRPRQRLRWHQRRGLRPPQHRVQRGRGRLPAPGGARLQRRGRPRRLRRRDGPRGGRAVQRPRRRLQRPDGRGLRRPQHGLHPGAGRVPRRRRAALQPRRSVGGVRRDARSAGRSRALQRAG